MLLYLELANHLGEPDSDEVERTAGKVLDFRGALNRISVVSATLSDRK